MSVAEVSLILVTNGRGQILLGRRADNGKWTLPGGGLNPGESPEDGACRELLEETGCESASLTFLRTAPPNQPDGPILHCFSATLQAGVRPHNRNDPDSELADPDSGWKWVDCRDGLPSNVYDHLHGPDDDSNVVRAAFDLRKNEHSEWLDAGFGIQKSELAKADDSNSYAAYRFPSEDEAEEFALNYRGCYEDDWKGIGVCSRTWPLDGKMGERVWVAVRSWDEDNQKTAENLAHEFGGHAADPLDDAIYDELRPEARRIAKSELAKGDEDYRGEHGAPGRGAGNAPLHDLTGIYPDDFHSPEAHRLYGSGEPYDAESIRTMQSVRNRPNARVRIYRAVPYEPTNAEKIARLQQHKAYYLKHGQPPADADRPPLGQRWYDWASDAADRLRALEPPAPPPQEPVDLASALAAARSPAPKPRRPKSPLSVAAPSINPGDWVTINKKYAVDHGRNNLGGKFKIVSKVVPARHVYTDGNSVHEQGYDPGEDLGKSELVKGLSDIPQGVVVAGQGRKATTAEDVNNYGASPVRMDWSHLLPKGAPGYKLISVHHRDPTTPSRPAKVELHYGGAPVGRVLGKMDGDRLEVHWSILDDDHRGHGLGASMYEAMLANAHHNMGAKSVHSVQASESALGAHAAVSRKHNLGFREIEGRHGASYDYMLKFEVDPDRTEVQTLLRHPDPRERAMALKLSGVTEHDLGQGLLDPDDAVYAAAFAHPAAPLRVLAGHARDLAGNPIHHRHDDLLHDPRLESDHVSAMHAAVQDDVDLPVGLRAARLAVVASHPVYRFRDRLVKHAGHVAVAEDSLEKAARDPHLYHVTTADRLAHIAAHGLDPNHPKVMGGQPAGGGWLHFTSPKGARYWHGFVDSAAVNNGVEEGSPAALPVVLRVPAKVVGATEKDHGGSADARAPAFRTRNPVAPEHLSIHTPSGWVPVGPVDHTAGFYTHRAGATSLTIPHTWQTSPFFPPELRQGVARGADDLVRGEEIDGWSDDLAKHAGHAAVSSAALAPDLGAVDRYPTDASREEPLPHLAGMRQQFLRYHADQEPKFWQSGLPVKEGKDYAGEHGLPGLHGGSPKVVHRDVDSAFLVKPYYLRDDPNQGWSEATSQALYHAAGLGDLHQKSFVAPYGGVPATVIRLQPGEPVHRASLQTRQDPAFERDARRIAFMDHLTSQGDRDPENLLVSNGRPLAIDNADSFEYDGLSSQRDKFRRFPVSFPKTPDGRPDPAWARSTGTDLASWWGPSRDAVRRTMADRLRLVADPKRRAAIAQGFERRAAALDRVAANPADPTWPDRLLEP